MNHFVSFLKKTLFQGALKFLACVILLLLFSTSLFAGNYTWNGTINSDYSNTSNWSPSGTPGTNDTITINSGKPNLELDQDRTVNRLILYGSTIDLDTNELHVTQRASLNGGDVIGESLKLRGTYAFFQGTDFNCTLDVVVGQIKFSGGTFDQTGSFEQNGGASGWGEGGCVFNAEVTIKNTGATYLRMGESEGDVFNDVVHFYSTNVYALQLAYGDTTIYNNAVYLNSTGNGGISFCASLDTNHLGYALFAQEGEILTGSSGFTAGNINMKHLLYESTNSANLTGSGTSTLTLSESNFAGKVNFSSTNIYVKTTVFNDSTLLVRSGATSSQSWSGGNIFKGVTTISSTFSSNTSYTFTLALDSGDVFEKDVYFNTQILTMRVAFKGTTKFYGDVNINSPKVVFNAGRGIFMCSGEMNQSIGGSAAYLIGKLHLNKEAGKVEMMRSCTIDSSLTLSGGLLQTDSLISLKSPVTTTGSSANSFIDGPVKKTGNSAFVFPIGDQGKYRPLTISAPSQATDAFSAQYFYSPQQAGTSTDTTIGEISPCNYWDLQRKTGTSNVYVTLSWDSIGCCVLDSSNIKVINWNNSVWKDLGKGSLGGNANTGQITSAIVPYTYGLITIGTDPIITLDIFPVVDRNNTDEGWYHSFVAEDPIYGYNGSNTIEPGKSWQDYANVDLLKEKNVKSLRIPSGTTANYWDWREGWFLKEHELPEGWLYEKEKYKATNPGGNEMINIKPHVDELGAAPVYLFNMLTSDFHYQLASLYRAHQINLPVKFVELGNEFYLNEAHHRSKFPNASDYAIACNDWTSQLKAIAPFADVKVAVIGCDGGDDSPGRRRLWMERVLDNLDPQAQIDAITIHQYYGNGLGSQPFSGSTVSLKTMLSRPFKEIELLKDHELNLINDFNEGPLSSHPLKTWITEFNLRTSGHGSTGTWAHGLFHAAMALSYLESQNITSIISHTMSSDVLFGNIFDSNDGFAAYAQNGNYPATTNQYEYTALGAAFNQITKAARYATDAYKVNFNGINDQDLPYLYNTGVNTTSVREVYAWLFESAAGNELIVLNLGGNSFHMYLDDIFQSVGLSTHPLRYERLFSVDITGGITGSPVTSIPPTPVGYDNYYLITSNELPVSTNSNGTFVPISNYSLTRISQKIPGFILNVTDDHICTSTSTEASSTSIIITGGVSPYSIIETDPNNGTSTYNQPDSVITFDADQTTGLYAITVTDANNSTATATITVDERPEVTVVTTALIPPALSCTTSYQLVATIDPAPANYEYYTFLWTPSTGMETFSGSCNPGGVTPMCSTIVVNPEQTTSYRVYVHDGTCWSRSAPTVIDRATVNHVDIGEDLTVCYDGTNAPIIKLTAILDSDPQHPFTGSFTWELHDPVLNTSTPLSSCSTKVCEVIVPTTYIGRTYKITAEPDPSGFLCSVSDEMELYITQCCSCGANSLSLNPVQGSNIENHVFSSQLSQQMLNPYFLKANDDFEPIYDIKGWIPVVYPNTSQTPNSNTICINGDLIIDRDIAFRDVILRMNENSKIRILDDHLLILQGCSISTCNRIITDSMWDGIIAERMLDKREPRLFIDQSSTNRTFIAEAKSAVTLKNGAEYIIENTDFTNNYVDIDVADYGNVIQQNLLTTTKNLFSVHSNTYSSSGSLLMAPYNNVHKYAAIRLDDVERFVLGDSTDVARRNSINNSIYGIRAMNSGFEVYNTGFSEIDNYDSWSTRTLAGSAIYGDGFNDGADRHVLIGATTAGTGLRNAFTSSVNGIVSVGEMNLKVFNNVFGSGSTNERLVNYGIWTHGSNKKSAYITRGNEFYDYYVGIRSFGIHPDGIYHIGFNNFFNAYIPNWSVVNSFQGTAIHMSNSYVPPSFIGQSEVPPINIYNNEIGQINDEAEIEPRIGIFTSNIYQPIIQNNNIYYFRAAQVSKPHSIGIWAQNCIAPRVAGNLILEHQNINQGYGANLIGMKFDRNINPCIGSQNITENLGYGLSFWDNNGQVALSTNQFTNCDNGVNLDWAEIGTQGDPDRTDDNGWTDRNVSPVLNRVNGLTLSNLPIRWYYQPTPAEFSPLPSGSVNATIINSPGNPPIDCPIIQNVASRNQTFGYVIGDSARYEENYQPSFSYSAKMITHKTLKRDTSLMYMDDETDESFIDFYNAMSQSNIEKYDSVALLITQGEFAVAAALLAGIEDTNDQETFLTNFYTLYLTKIVYDSLLSNADSSLLIEIAYSHSLLYGDAVYLARNALFLEIHDETLESNLRRAVFRKQPIERNLSAQPNPASERTQIKMNAEDYSGRMQLLDGHGRLIIDRNLQNGWLDVKSLNSGVYFIKIPEEDSSSILCKLVIIR